MAILWACDVSEVEQKNVVLTASLTSKLLDLPDCCFEKYLTSENNLHCLIFPTATIWIYYFNLDVNMIVAFIFNKIK